MSIDRKAERAFARLQEWYLSQCDNDWEHSYGIKIDTLDNPGWTVTIDLAGTKLEGLVSARQRIDRDEDDWAQYEVRGQQFIACGGPLNLEELIDMFLLIWSEIDDRASDLS